MEVSPKKSGRGILLCHPISFHNEEKPQKSYIEHRKKLDWYYIPRMYFITVYSSPILCKQEHIVLVLVNFIYIFFTSLTVKLNMNLDEFYKCACVWQQLYIYGGQQSQ